MIKTLALALSVTSIASVANAADLVVKARPAPLAVMVTGVDWTGAYVGGSISGVWGETDTFFSGSGVPIKTNPEGAVFGILAGYDWQLPSNVVIGARLAIPFASSVDDTVADPTFPATVSHKTSLIWATMLTAHIGLAMDRWLPYAGFGGAWAEGKGTFSSPGGVFTDTQTHSGWTVLAGVRYWLAQHWWVAAQYNHVELGAKTYSFPGGVRNVGMKSDTISGILAYKL